MELGTCQGLCLFISFFVHTTVDVFLFNRRTCNYYRDEHRANMCERFVVVQMNLWIFNVKTHSHNSLASNRLYVVELPHISFRIFNSNPAAKVIQYNRLTAVPNEFENTRAHAMDLAVSTSDFADCVLRSNRYNLTTARFVFVGYFYLDIIQTCRLNTK